MVICNPKVNSERYSSPHIARMVRSLKIVGLPSLQAWQEPDVSTHDTRNSPNTNPEPFLDLAAWTVLARLTEVQDLFLVDFYWAFTSRERDALAAVFHRVETLRLLVAFFQDGGDFQTFLGCFPQLCTLDLAHVSTLR